jgi:hypothetical protein
MAGFAKLLNAHLSFEKRRGKGAGTWQSRAGPSDDRGLRRRCVGPP